MFSRGVLLRVSHDAFAIESRNKVLALKQNVKLPKTYSCDKQKRPRVDCVSVDAGEDHGW